MNGKRSEKARKKQRRKGRVLGTAKKKAIASARAVRVVASRFSEKVQAKRRFTVYLDPCIHGKLKKYSEKRKTPMTDVVSELLTAFFQE